MRRKYLRLALLMCGLAGAAIGICTNTVGVFYAPASEDLGILRGSFALHSTLSLIATGVISLWVPALMKRMPYKTLLWIAVIAAVGSTVLMGMSSQTWQFNLLGIIRGLGAGCFAAVPLTMIINHWFVKNNGLVTSVALSFSGVVGALCQPVLTACIFRMGWRFGYGVQALILLGLCIPALVTPFTLTPQESGLVPYGEDDGPAASKDAAGNASPTASYRISPWSLVFLAYCLVTFFHTFISGISQHMPGMALSLGLSAEIGAWMTSCAMVGNIVFKLVIGVVSDRLNPLKASLIMIGLGFFTKA